MKLLDRIREREIAYVNDFGHASGYFRVGNTVTEKGVRYRVTRHRAIPTAPFHTMIIYGVRR